MLPELTHTEPQHNVQHNFLCSSTRTAAPADQSSPVHDDRALARAHVGMDHGVVRPVYRSPEPSVCGVPRARLANVGYLVERLHEQVQ